MNFKPGYCPYCNHEIQINMRKDLSTCPFCGKKYVVQYALNHESNYLIQDNKKIEIKKYPVNKKVIQKQNGFIEDDFQRNFNENKIVMAVIITVIILLLMCSFVKAIEVNSKTTLMQSETRIKNTAVYIEERENI